MFNTQNLTSMSQILMCIGITLGCELKSRILGIIPNFLLLLYLYLREVEGICPPLSNLFKYNLHTERYKAQLICIWITLGQYIEHIHYIQKILACFFLVSIVNLGPPPLTLFFQVSTIWISVTTSDSDILMQIVSQSCCMKQYPVYFSGLNSAFILDSGVPRNTLSYGLCHLLIHSDCKSWNLCKVLYWQYDIESYLNIFKHLEQLVCVYWVSLCYIWYK